MKTAGVDEEAEPGLVVRTKVREVYKRGMFQGVDSVDKFAALLGVPKKSIPLVQPIDIPCKSKDCQFIAIARNGGHCPYHERSWYPLANQKGSRMLGPEFLRYDEHPGNCDCKHLACREAGYFPLQDPLYIPAAGRDVMLQPAGLLSESAKKRLQKNKEAAKLHLNPWHFFPEHREKQDDGTWRLIYDNRTASLLLGIP